MALIKRRRDLPGTEPGTTSSTRPATGPSGSHVDDDLPVVTKPKKRGPSPVWLVPLMLTLFGLGLLWIVVYYITQGDMPFIGDIGGVALLIGFGFIIAGFALATQWR